MKPYLRSALFIILVSFQALGQRAKDGNYTVTSSNSVLNSYTTLSSNATIGQSLISVSSNALNGGFFTTNLAAGDLILIIQMQGTSMNVDAYAASEYVNSNGQFWGPYTTPFGHQTTGLCLSHFGVKLQLTTKQENLNWRRYVRYRERQP